MRKALGKLRVKHGRPGKRHGKGTAEERPHRRRSHPAMAKRQNRKH